MDTHKNLIQENEVANRFYQVAPILAVSNADKRTLSEEADLTEDEVQQMEQQTGNSSTSPGAHKGRKGSSGDEEKDITD